MSPHVTDLQYQRAFLRAVLTSHFEQACERTLPGRGVAVKRFQAGVIHTAAIKLRVHSPVTGV